MNDNIKLRLQNKNFVIVPEHNGMGKMEDMMKVFDELMASYKAMRADTSILQPQETS